MSRHLNEQLLDAACQGNTVTIRKMIAAGANPNYQNEQINTPLMWAVTHRHLDAAQVLVESGANVNGQDCLGGTALMVAASNGDLPMLELGVHARCALTEPVERLPRCRSIRSPRACNPDRRGFPSLK
jgi:ankyrin repeat protein